MASYGESSKQQNFLTVPAAIVKADISRLGGLKGAINSEDVLLGENVYVAHSLAFRGFAGALNKASGKYEGVYRFKPYTLDLQGELSDDRFFSAAELPGLVADETELIEDSELEGEGDEPQ